MGVGARVVIILGFIKKAHAPEGMAHFLPRLGYLFFMGTLWHNDVFALAVG
jgi:hypothetical protein